MFSGAMPPLAQRYKHPHSFDHAERPRALQKTVDRTQAAGDGETEGVDTTALFESITNHHRADRAQTKDR
jgi:hypothetical protein